MVTVCRVNLDNFSVINDGIGLSAGDFLLCSVAARLQELVAGERAMVARMATDDFAILIEERTERDLSQFAATMNARLCEPVYVGDQGDRGLGGNRVGAPPRGGISAGSWFVLRISRCTGPSAWVAGNGISTI